MKKKTLGRAAALGLAGLTVLPACGMIASAEAYPTYVYEFTYGGIGSTQMYWKSLNATKDNTYIKFADQDAAQNVFKPTNGFYVAELGDFWSTVNAAYNASKGTDSGYVCTNKPDDASWQYAKAAAFDETLTPLVPEESYNPRDGYSNLLTFAFKTKAERDAAMNDIIAKNKAEYASKYSAASSALSKDLSNAISEYQKAQRDLISKVKAEATKQFKEQKEEDVEEPVVSLSDISTALGIDFSSLDPEVDTTIYQKEGEDKDLTLTLTEWTSKQNAYVSEQVKELKDIATQVKKEFTEAYQSSNWAFDYDSAADGADGDDEAVPFESAHGAVETTSTGAYIHGTAGYELKTGGEEDLTLSADYYRTVGAYYSPDSYAFQGEIIISTDRKKSTSEAIEALLLDSDCWSLFSVLAEGKPTDNNNTTEGGTSNKDKTDDDDKDTTADQTAVYKVGGAYYPTYSAAYAAAGGDDDKISFVRDYTTLPNDYFSQVTGSFYSTYADALKASGNVSSKVSVFNGAPTNTGASNNLDPYYYYWLNKQNQNGGTTSGKDTSSATLGKKTGWSAISNYLNKADTGSSATVNMNKETTVPSTVLSAIEGKNVSVKFLQENGASLTVNGKDIADAKNVDINVTYNTKSISKKLIQNAFKKNGAVSSAQISIDEGSFGFESDLTVKFNSKRAGYSAKIYRYNSSRNSLQLVDTATVSNSGKTTFNNITKGGEFVIVLFED